MTTLSFSAKVIAIAAAMAILGSAQPANAQEKIKFGTGSSISLTSAPLTMGLSMGHFKQEGLDVEVIPFRGGSGVLIPQVVNKSIDVGFPTLDPLIIARQPGRDYMPLRFFYNVTRTSIYEIVVLESSDVRRLADLKGKKIGVGALSWGNIPITKTMLRDANVADAELIPVGMGAAAYQALTSGRIDALNLFDVPHADMEAQGIKIRRLPVPGKFDELGSNSLITHEDTIKNNPKMLVAVGRAMAKATVACEANVRACVKAFWATYPEQKPTQGTEEEKLANAERVLRTRLDKMMTKGSLGEFPPQMFKDWIEVLYAGGQITTSEISVESLYTNQFVKAFNEFDRQEVVRAAKALN